MKKKSGQILCNTPGVKEVQIEFYNKVENPPSCVETKDDRDEIKQEYYECIDNLNGAFVR